MPPVGISAVIECRMHAAPGFFFGQRGPFIPFRPWFRDGVCHGGLPVFAAVFRVWPRLFPQQERAGCLPGAPQVRPTGLPSRFVRARALLGQVDKLNGFLCHEGGRLAQEFFCLEHLVRGRPSGVLGCPSPSCPLVTRGGGSTAILGTCHGFFYSFLYI